MTSTKQYSVTYKFGDEPQVFEWVVEAADPEHAEQFVRQLVWIYANHDDWQASPALSPHRLQSLQFIEVHPIERN